MFKTDWKLGEIVEPSDMNRIEEALQELEGMDQEITEAIDSHANRTDNPHAVTKTQVGLSNVPNVATNNQSPTYTEATTLATLTSGEVLSTAFGKIKKAIADLIAHIANKTNPHAVTKAQVGLGNVDNTADANKPVSTTQQAAMDVTYQQATGYADAKIAALINGAPSTLDTLKEIADAMATNDTVVKALDTAIGTKAAQAQVDGHINNSTIHITTTERTNLGTAYTHSQKTSGNPHGVTKSDVGLGNVPNVTTNNQAPTYNEATALATLTSGEALSVAFGKLKLVVKNVISMVKLLGSTDISAIGDGTVTGIITDINSNLTVQNAALAKRDRGFTVGGSLSTAGYYRVASILNSASLSDSSASFLLQINIAYGYTNNMSVTLLCNLAFNKFSITKLGGAINSIAVTKVRISKNAAGTVYIDIYYAVNVQNGAYVSINDIGSSRSIDPIEGTITSNPVTDTASLTTLIEHTIA